MRTPAVHLLAAHLLLIPAALAVPQSGAQPDAVPARAPVSGLTGSSPEQPIGDVAIEVREYTERIATWEFWRGAPVTERILAQGRSDAAGRFAFEVPFGRLYDVRFAKPGHRPGRVVVPAGRPFLGPVVPGAPEAEPETTTPPGEPCLLARFVDRTSGAPVAGAHVRPPWGNEWLATSDAEGRVRILEAPKLREDVLLVFAPGYRIAALAKEHFAAPGTAPVERSYELEAGPALRGRLVDAEDQPLPGVLVVTETDVPVGEDGIYSAVAWWTRTDAEGRYESSGFVPGARYWVRTLLNTTVPCELGRGRFTDAGDVDLGTARTGPTFAVLGRVTNEGRPLGRDGRVHVLALSATPVHQKLVARNTPSYPIDPSGLYRIPALAPGQYELCFWVDGLEHEVRVVEAPRPGAPVRLDVDMGPGRTITGRVLDTDGNPAGGVLLRALVWKDEYQVLVPAGDLSHNGRFLVGNIRVLTRPDGSFRLERVRSRVPILLLVLPEGRPKLELRLGPDATEPVEVRLR